MASRTSFRDLSVVTAVGLAIAFTLLATCGGSTGRLGSGEGSRPRHLLEMGGCVPREGAGAHITTAPSRSPGPWSSSPF